MALVKCPDCEKMISHRVKQCPFCGCPSDFFIVEDISASKDNESLSNVQDNEVEKKVVSIPECNCSVDEKVEKTVSFEKPAKIEDTTTDVIVVKDDEVNGVIFGLETERFPNHNKYSFKVIVDPERETDNHAKGKTHVIFRIGNSKYLTVLKDNLFYAQIKKEIDNKGKIASEAFERYLCNVKNLSGMTSGAKDKANNILVEYCQFLVEKLIQYGIYEYDLKNFASFCGGSILIENTKSYENILRQEKSVDAYAENLAYKRDLERSTRSQWSGGGFGVKGAIKGAVTAGALNAATGAFRSIGDGMTDIGDRNSIQSKYSAIVNDKNKYELLDDFSRGCLFRAKISFYHILAGATGWNASEVMEEKWKVANAKFNNLKHINDRRERERILIELLSDHPYYYEALDYAMSNYVEYDFNIGDLLHFVKRISEDAFETWMIKHFADALQQIEETKSGNERKRALIAFGITFGVIDNNLTVIQTENTDFGASVIMSLIETDMMDYGFSLKDLDEQTNDFDKAQNYFEELTKIGKKYRVFDTDRVKNELTVIGVFANNEDFIKLQEKVNEQLRKICTIRGILCEDIQEAKTLSYEWSEFDIIYSPFDSYADYDSVAMQEVINTANNKGFVSKHVLSLISGENGLIDKKHRLEEREMSEVFKKSQQIVKRLLPYAGECFFVYGSIGFLEKAKTIRGFDIVKNQEEDIFPLVIYDASDANGFKGFIISDRYFYNYNSIWGIGLGDKILSLYDIRETTKNGKNRLFRFSNGKTKKIKIIGYEETVIGALSDIFAWESDLNGSAIVESSDLGYAGTVESRKTCVNCGGLVKSNVKFCNFCGMPPDAMKKRCDNCEAINEYSDKYCRLCGSMLASKE